MQYSKIASKLTSISVPPPEENFSTSPVGPPPMHTTTLIELKQQF